MRASIWSGSFPFLLPGSRPGLCVVDQGRALGQHWRSIRAMSAVHAGVPQALTGSADQSSVIGTWSCCRSEIMALHRLAFAAAVVSAGIAAALAQDARYPTRTVSIVVANAAGGGTDYLARLVGQKMQERLGQSVIVENKPGANSMIAAQAVIRAAADGHTLLMGSIGMLTVNPAVEIGRASRR